MGELLTPHSASLHPPRNGKNIYNVYLISVQAKTTKSGGVKKPPVTKRTIQVKNCDDADDIQTKDSQTLTGKIVVEDCPCESRYKNNATRLAAVSSTVATQLRTYFQKLYNTKINYQVDLTVIDGNKTYTVFSYTVKAPQTDHSKLKNALIQTCKDDQVSQLQLNCLNGHEYDYFLNLGEKIYRR